jgi:hypothetical protein
VFAAVAEWEREEIAERIRTSVPIRAKLGKPINGKATLGYQWINRHLVLNPSTAPVRKLLYRRLIQQRRLRTVAQTLNTRGFHTSTGALFSLRTVRRLIQDPTPTGSHRANYTTIQVTRSLLLGRIVQALLAKGQERVANDTWEKVDPGMQRFVVRTWLQRRQARAAWYSERILSGSKGRTWFTGSTEPGIRSNGRKHAILGGPVVPLPVRKRSTRLFWITMAAR